MGVISGAQAIALIDVEAVRREGLDYLLLQPLRGFATLGSIYVLSCLLGGLSALAVHWKKQPSQRPGAVWRDVLGQKKETHDAWATVELRDGSFLQGQVASYTLEASEPRELALKAPMHQRRPESTETEDMRGDFLILREEDVLCVVVEYQPKPVTSTA